MSRPGMKPEPPRWEASTLENSHSNSLLITIRNSYIWARDQWRMLEATDKIIQNWSHTFYWHILFFLLTRYVFKNLVLHLTQEENSQNIFHWIQIKPRFKLATLVSSKDEEKKLLLDAEPVPLRDLFYLRCGAVGVVAGITAVAQQHIAVVRPAQAHLAGRCHNRQHVLDMATDKKIRPHCYRVTKNIPVFYKIESTELEKEQFTIYPWYC